ncbi:MAG: cytochrome c [Steroidobacteraceae bacterium]
MSMFKREWRTRLVTIAATAVISTMGAVAMNAAMAATPAETIKVRHQGMKDLGGAMKTINDQLKTDAPNAAAIKGAGVKVKAAVDGMPNWFPKGTGPETGVETAAKPEIWSDAADFAEKMKAFQAEGGKIVSLADAGDVEGLRTQVKTAGKACGNCHDKNRVKKES